MLPLVLEVMQLEDEEACWDLQTSYGEPAVRSPAYGNMDGVPGRDWIGIESPLAFAPSFKLTAWVAHAYDKPK